MIRSFFICILLVAASHDPCWGLGAEDILDRVQHRYAAGGFEADFVQESHLKAMGMVDTAKGHLYFRHPGMMRWHYKMPEEYLIITDGDTVWIYRPAENQVMLGRAVNYFGSEKGTDLFTKPGELSKEFILELAPKELQEKDRYVLRLIPKTDRPSLAELYLFVSKETFDIVKSVNYNAFGDKTTIRFDGYRFDQGIDSSLFVFEIPNGAEVLQLQGEQGSINHGSHSISDQGMNPDTNDAPRNR
jgi:outer membrane lipoprotein carrier protein